MQENHRSINLVGALPLDKNNKEISISLSEIHKEITVTEDLIIFKKAEILKVYDRRCDHNGGALCLRRGTVECPNHGWKFDPELGSYINVQLQKKELDFVIKEGKLKLEITNDVPKIPSTYSANTNREIRVSYLSHACLLFESKDFLFATDPWIQGFAFAGGWWINELPMKNWKEKLNSIDFIYISHNHPDHLNQFTLKHINKDMNFIVPKFRSQSVINMLKKFGFKNITELEFQKYYQFQDSDLFLSIFNSGDFRDDSGLYFTYGDFSFLTAVDSNYLNFGKLPNDITLFAAGYAGGASGYPYCFENISQENKEKIHKNDCATLKTSVKNSIKSCNAQYFLPYAGSFVERAKRDLMIREVNVKNKTKDFINISKNCTTLAFEQYDSFVFKNNELIHKDKILREDKFPENPESFIAKEFRSLSLSNNFLREYFENSRFNDDLVVYISLTNDAFNYSSDQIIIDFRKTKPLVSFKDFKWADIKKNAQDNDFSDTKLLHLKIRKDAFIWVINNKMPWEDLSIGFQCRIDRFPDIYNVDFWDHFTNKYI